MKRLYLLILRSFFGPFLLIFFIVLFVLLIQFLWRYIDELVGKGLDTQTIIELMVYISASLVPMALPLSILMSSLMTFGNLGERYELTAIKASGISLQRILRPLVIVVLLMSIGAFFFANDVLPYANLQMRSLMYDIRQQRPELQIKPGEFNNLIDGYSIRVDEKDPKTNVLYGVTIYDHSEAKGNRTVILADSGTMVVTENDQYFIITLFSGYSYNELFDTKKPRKRRSYPHRYDTFDEQQIIIELEGFGLQRTDQNLFKSHYSMLDLNQLTIAKDSIGKEISNRQDNLQQTLMASSFFKKRLPNKPAPGNRITQNQTPQRLTPPSINTRKGLMKTSVNATISDSAKTTPAVKPELLQEGTPAADPNGNSDKPSTLTVKLIDTDSLFNSFTLAEKSQVTGTALSYARTAKNMVINSQQSLEMRIENLRRHEVEWHRKFTISIACLLFLFLGAPLGAIIRKGGLGLPLIISVVFFILYYILSLIGEKLVRQSILPDYQGMWMTSGLFAIMGAFITYKATTDSSIFNMDTYSNFIKKIFGQRYNVVDKIHIQTAPTMELGSEAKPDNLYSALVDLNDAVDKTYTSTINSLRLPDFLLSLFSTNSDSDLIIFERYYYNTFKAIVNHPKFHNKNVRAKAYEFPALNNKEFEDVKILQYILIILACIPPLTLIIALRRYIKIIVLRAKLKQIKQLIPEMGTLVKISDVPEQKNENTSGLQ
ncbi:MAG TPA: hypothetical protein DDX98_05740 [Bacteroidales bacterium]|nr:hypothetical protein [Bacteroidales bacterium]